MSVIRLIRFDGGRAPGLAAPQDFAHPAIAAAPAAEPQPDPASALFRSAAAQLWAERDVMEEALRAEAAEALERTVRALAPFLLESGARDAVKGLLRSFSRAGAETGIEIAAHPATAEALKSEITAQVSLVPDEAMRPGDLRISWPHGGMTRDAARLADDFLAALRDDTKGASTNG